MAVKHKPTSVKADKERRQQQERVNAAPDQVEALITAQQDTDAMVVDLTYQMTLLELGLTE